MYASNVIEILPDTFYSCRVKIRSDNAHANGSGSGATPHLIPLLDELFHALGSIEHLLGNRRAMWYICLLCGWPLKSEKGAEMRPVDDIEWLMKTSKLAWMSRGQAQWSCTTSS